MAADSINSIAARTQIGIQQSQSRIASGQRINTAADDPAGFAVASRLSRNIDGYNQSLRNVADGISLVQTAESGLATVTENLQRIRELALQAANGINSSRDRLALNQEAQSLKSEINRVVETSSFNQQNLFNEDLTIGLQLGAASGDRLSFSTDNLQQQLINVDFERLDLTTAANATQALDVVDKAGQAITERKVEFGALQNRLESSSETLLSSRNNAEQSRSRISDTDVAREVTELTALELRERAGIALKVQANQQEAYVLQLLN